MVKQLANDKKVKVTCEMWSKTSIINSTVSLKNPLFANAKTNAKTKAQFVPDLIGDPD